MAQVKLTLRPPPNVDFVQGYPGIPPAIDRQQACIQGQVEVRVGAPNVKAKYIRVELRKIETLPGGNNFYDIVGSEPASLWTSGDEYGIVQNSDFPFMIRIPESLPPSITLEGRAGVQYELVASVSTKGKKGWFRTRKAVVHSCSAPITIDKHDLHSTWPVYCQQDSREVTHDGVTLVIERSNSCFGPGDKLSVIATVKSDSLHTVILRGFDYTLKEVIEFRGAPSKGAKRANEQRKVGILDEGKLAVNATLYGGTQHRAELTLTISPKHSTTTLSAARHIDINYVLTVRGILGSGTHLVMDVPVIVSNWPRAVSQEAIRRIGAAPNLSLTQPGTPSGASPPPTDKATTFSGRQTSSKPGAAQFKTMPASSDTSRKTGAGEFGTKSDVKAGGSSSLTKGHSQTRGEASSNNRDAIAMALGKEISESSAPKSSSPSKPAWPTAENEKKKLYETARARVERVQGVSSPSSVDDSPSPNPSPPASSSAKPMSSGSRTTPWPTSEEEKARLFEKAKAAAKRTQGGQLDDLPSASNPDLKASAAASSSSNGNASPKAGVTKSQSATAGGSGRSFPTAEDEKAALRRYEEAKRAVDRTQGQNNLTPPTPSGGGGGGGSSRQSIGRKLSIANPAPIELGDELPSFDDSQPNYNFIQPGLSEKERLKREYAMRDAERSAPAYAPPPANGSSSSGEVLSEKERLRRRYEAQDAAAQSPSPPQQPPPSRAHIYSRPTPPIPTNGVQALSAKEEKALLRARYEAEGQQSNNDAPPYPVDAPTNTHSSPPPLAPRPPADYIKQTQEEDARLSRFVSDERLNLADDYTNGSAFQPPPLPPKPSE